VNLLQRVHGLLSEVFVIGVVGSELRHQSAPTNELGLPFSSYGEHLVGAVSDATFIKIVDYLNARDLCLIAPFSR
jgi:hypothetical protein